MNEPPVAYEPQGASPSAALQDVNRSNQPLMAFPSLGTSSSATAISCPENGCDERFSSAIALFYHRAAHCKTPIQCAFTPSCGALLTDKADLVEHIWQAHQQSGKEAVKYVNKLMGVSETENKTLVGVSKEKTPPKSPLLKRKIIKLEDAVAEMLQVRPDVSDDSDVSEVCVPSKKRYKCPKCAKHSVNSSNLQYHYRRHTLNNPYTCLFENCGLQTRTREQLKYHIRRFHKEQDFEQFIWADEKMLQEESKELGIKRRKQKSVCAQTVGLGPVAPSNQRTLPPFAVVSGQPVELPVAPPNQPTLPLFTTIYRWGPAGEFICPLAASCGQSRPTIALLKEHYRVHAGDDFRPFKCKFLPESWHEEPCQFESKFKLAVVGHILRDHGIYQMTENDQFDSLFIASQSELLAAEDALFAAAQIEILQIVPMQTTV